MKKSILTTLLIYSTATFLLTATTTATAQEVISSAGESLQNSSTQIDFTVGQLTINTYSEGTVVLTQGFHQTFEEMVLGLNRSSIPIELSVYPNPATSFIKLSAINSQEDISYQLYDVNGLSIQSGIFSSEYELNLKGYAKGIYMLLLIDGNNDLIQSFKIQVK